MLNYPTINQDNISTRQNDNTIRNKSRYNLRPSPKSTQNTALLAKTAIPNEPTKDTKEDLTFTSEMLEKLNVIDQDNMIKQDDHHLPMLDQSPTDLISNFLKHNNNNTTKTNAADVVHKPISGTCLEHRELIKTSEKKV